MKENKLGRRREEYRRRLHELEKLLHKTIDYKGTVIRLEHDSLAEYRLGKITYEQYQAIVNSKHDGKTRDEWIAYYDSYINKYREDIEATKQAIKELERQQSSESRLNYGLWIAVIVGLLGLAVAFGPQITGFVTAPANVTVVNVAPNVTSVTITPDPIYTNVTATCNAVTEDWNQDTVTSYYRWFNNNSGTFEKLAFTDSTLHHSNFTATNNVTCQVIPSDGIQGLNGTARNGSIFVSNLAPIVRTVEITDNGTDFGYVVTPVAGQNAIVAIRARVIDGDCSVENNVTAYICDTSVANECSNSVFNFSQSLEFDRVETGSTCFFSYNGTTNMPQFWREAGTFNLTVYTIDNSTGAELTDNNFTGFTYNSLQAINYNSRIYLGNSTIELGSWSTNTTAVNLTNYGNVNVSLQWNVSNATRLGGGDTWKIINDFILDDDSVYSAPQDDTLIRFANLSNTLVQFNQTSGLVTCEANECDTGAYAQWTRNETLATYFHIKPPAGLLAGTYSSTLWIVTTAA